MDINFKHEKWMKEALKEAQKASQKGEIPIGAVLVDGGKIIARASNKREASKNPLHHAEMVVLEKAAKKKGDWRLTDSTLYVTLEPCPMCLGALLQARVGKLMFGCADPKRTTSPPLKKGDTGGFVFPSLKEISSLEGNNHTLEVVGGILENDCSQALKSFFRAKRRSA